MSIQTETTQTVTIAEAVYTIEYWSGDPFLISKKGTAYMVHEGVTQPHSFLNGTAHFTIAELEPIAHALQVQPAELFKDAA